MGRFAYRMEAGGIGRLGTGTSWIGGQKGEKNTDEEYSNEDDHVKWVWMGMGTGYTFV